MAKYSVNTVQTTNLDHHGLIAAICNDVDLVNRVNKRIESKDPRRIVSPGHSVKAMILNGLGFANRQLYLMPQFLENKPVDKLLGKGFVATNFDDHTLGKALDEIAAYGATRFFAEIAFEIAIERGLIGKSVHVDTTTISTYGNQGSDKTDKIQLTPGYSKDKRFDLNQLILSMVTSGKAEIPLWANVVSGNASDHNTLINTIESVNVFRKQLQVGALENDLRFHWVCDAAGYSAPNLKALENCLWVMRVPERIKEAAELVHMDDASFYWQQLSDGYKISAHSSEYAEIKQRWILVQSEQAYQREMITLQKNIAKAESTLTKKLKSLEKKVFKCAADAYKWGAEIQKEYPLFEISFTTNELKKYSTAGRPPAGAELAISGYSLIAQHKKNDVKIAETSRSKGKFIIATNDFDLASFSDVDVLSTYKEQQQAERGFRFIKDPWFLLDSLFLKNVDRIIALMAVMTLCLLIYNLAQDTLRKALIKTKNSIPNQKGKLYQNPTMRWVMQLMEGIVVINNVTLTEIISNLNQVRIDIIEMFGPAAMKIYGIQT